MDVDNKAAIEKQEPAKIWNVMFISIFFANMVMNLGQFMANSLLSVYADSLGATPAAIGLLMSAFAVTAILFRVVSAPAMDTYNRKYIVIFAMLTLAVAFFGFSMSRSIEALLFSACCRAAAWRSATPAAWQWFPRRSPRSVTAPAWATTPWRRWYRRPWGRPSGSGCPDWWAFR